jgi:murein DD-endopeptidase MepM/ murein hydrolase activator NlpD
MYKPNGKFNLFVRKNAMYLILGICVLAIGLSMTLMLISSDTTNLPSSGVVDDIPQEKPNEDVLETPTETVISFIMPVNNASKIEDYSTTMVFNSTLNRYSQHLAIDFSAPEGTSVVCVYDGTVESVERSYLTGITVTIAHKDGVKSIYNSLGEVEDLSVGQTITQGEVIGTVGTSNLQESNDGAHLHFEVTENGEKINPLTYLVIEEK